MLQFVLFLYLLRTQNPVLINPMHVHDMRVMSTWDEMRILPGTVVNYDKGSKILTVKHQDRNIVKISDYKVQDKLTYVPRIPRRNENIVVLYCPEDKTLFTFIVEK